jgi:integrase
MPVRKRGDRWHVRLQIGGQRIERSLGPTATKADALDYEARLRQDVVSGKVGRTTPRTMEDALVRWLQGEAAQLTSYNNLLSKVRLLQPYAAGKRLDAIVQIAEDVKAAGIKEELAPATINRRLAILRRIANLAHDQWGWLDQPLGNRIKLLRGEKARHVYLTPDQVETLATHCQHPKVAMAIRLVARTGLREGELLRADTIFDGCIVVDDVAPYKPRLVPLPPDMQDIALPLGISYHTLRTYFERARKAASLPHVRFHDLRHTAASWWVQSGANMAVVRDLLGHANLAVTSRYTHLATGDMKRAAEAMGQALAKRGKNGAEIQQT